MITITPEMIKGIVEIPLLEENEGDFFYGAFFLVAGAIGNNIVCKGLKAKSSQRYAQIIEIIKQVGGIIEETEEGLVAKMGGNMQGKRLDCGCLTDILPAIAILCAFCKGESRICGISDTSKRDFLKIIASELSHLGMFTELTADGLIIRGGQTLRSDGTFVWNNSALAMALVVAASRSEGEIRIIGTENIQDEKFERFMELYNGLTKEEK